MLKRLFPRPERGLKDDRAWCYSFFTTNIDHVTNSTVNTPINIKNEIQFTYSLLKKTQFKLTIKYRYLRQIVYGEIIQINNFITKNCNLL